LSAGAAGESAGGGGAGVPFAAGRGPAITWRSACRSASGKLARHASGDSGERAAGGTGQRSAGVLGADPAAGTMNAGPPLPFEDVWRGLRDGLLESDLLRLLSQICSGPLLAAFTVFRDSDARRFRASGDEIYRDFCACLHGGGLAEFLLEFPELARLVNLCIGDWRDAQCEFLARVDTDFGQEEIVNLESSLSDRHGGRTVL